MPLVKSASRKALAKNIGKLISEGYKKQQAAAIAYDVQRRARRS